MPRNPRIIIPNTPMHITQRGNRRENIFSDEEDKEFYIKAFMFYKKKFKVKLFAWCLMDNHVHFVVEPSTKKGISKLFLCLNTKYVRYFNKKYKFRESYLAIDFTRVYWMRITYRKLLDTWN